MNPAESFSNRKQRDGMLVDNELPVTHDDPAGFLSSLIC